MNTEVKSYEIHWIPAAERLPTPTESSEQAPGLNILITVEDEQGNKEVSIGFYNHFHKEFYDLRAWYDMDEPHDYDIIGMYPDTGDDK